MLKNYLADAAYQTLSLSGLVDQIYITVRDPINAKNSKSYEILIKIRASVQNIPHTLYSFSILQKVFVYILRVHVRLVSS